MPRFPRLLIAAFAAGVVLGAVGLLGTLPAQANGACVNGSYATRYGCTSSYVPGYGYGYGWGSGYNTGYNPGWLGAYGSPYAPGFTPLYYSVNGDNYGLAPGVASAAPGQPEPNTYVASGSYCTSASGQKIWVPSGATPATMGCSG
jgi:hypothetical protein